MGQNQRYKNRSPNPKSITTKLLVPLTNIVEAEDEDEVEDADADPDPDSDVLFPDDLNVDEVPEELLLLPSVSVLVLAQLPVAFIVLL